MNNEVEKFLAAEDSFPWAVETLTSDSSLSGVTLSDLRSWMVKFSAQKIRAALAPLATIAENAPELNMSNYDEDDVSTLNSAMVEVCLGLRALMNEGESRKAGFICAQWKKLSDGCVARCDKAHAHEGNHSDSVIGIGWNA